ncbi:hypothetical protein ACQKWADRAFT_322405 [Trichoderma austrokoningii]
MQRSVLDPSKFYKIASTLIHTQLQNCGDKPPPLVLLQAFIITTWYEMVSGVRGIAWRSLGAAIRITYELQLHLVDLPLKLSPTNTDSDSVDIWIAKEERRRAWWTLWELEHATLLPVDETCWFNGEKRPSCFFEPDPVLRWKVLKKSENESGRAWFIVINSYLNDAHYLTNASVPVEASSAEDDLPSYARYHSASKQRKGQASKLAVLDNCISCLEMSLPQQFRFCSERFHSSSLDENTTNTHRKDSEKQTIHAMIHLSKIMILHKDCFRHKPWGAESRDDIGIFSNRETSPILGEFSSHSHSIWPKYLLAAENVIGIVRNTSTDHIRYRHPLLVNTFWIVAAIQLVQGAFAETDCEKILAQSSFELLCLILIEHEQYWSTSPVLLQNLNKLQRSLDTMRGCGVSQSTLVSQPSAARHSLEPESTPNAIRPQHADYNLNNDGSSNIRTWKEIGQSNITDRIQQANNAANEENLPLDIIGNLNDASFDDLDHIFKLDMSMDAIFSEMWHSF